MATSSKPTHWKDNFIRKKSIIKMSVLRIVECAATSAKSLEHVVQWIYAGVSRTCKTMTAAIRAHKNTPTLKPVTNLERLVTYKRFCSPSHVGTPRKWLVVKQDHIKYFFVF